MGMSYRRYLAGARVYGCLSCRTHLTTIHSMISRVRVAWHGIYGSLTDPTHPQAFNGQHGRAYLFEDV